MQCYIDNTSYQSVCIKQPIQLKYHASCRTSRLWRSKELRGKTAAFRTLRFSGLLSGKSAGDRVERISITFVGKLRPLVTVAEIASPFRDFARI